MKYYGIKGSAFGYASEFCKTKRKRMYFDALTRAGRKHARQQGKKESKDF
ncbi:hypothetical protein POP12_094 [Pectobacterium phage POP12]|nr:hypothetical protein POP12_094 [Pectobacterium phage POP12]